MVHLIVNLCSHCSGHRFRDFTPPVCLLRLNFSFCVFESFIHLLLYLKGSPLKCLRHQPFLCCGYRQSSFSKAHESRMDSQYLFKHPGGILTYLHEAHNHVVQIDVTQGCMVFAFSPHLVQEQIPAVHWRQQVLVFPKK